LKAVSRTETGVWIFRSNKNKAKARGSVKNVQVYNNWFDFLGINKYDWRVW